MHSNLSSYYFRNNYISSDIGFENTIFYENVKDYTNGTQNVLNCFSFDSEIMQHCVDNPQQFNLFPTNEKFFTFFMTITTHCLYEYNSLLDKNYALVDAVANSEIKDETFTLYNSLEPELKNTVREYYARAIDTELTLAYAINYLHENNLLDNTIIVLSGDHKASTNNILNYKKLYIEKVLNKPFQPYKNTVESFIYSKKISNTYLESYNESRKIDHLTEPVDLTPTILSLLGKNFNQEQCLGVPVINKSVINTTESVHSPLHHSFSFDKVESINLSTYDGYDIISKNQNYQPTQNELNDFIKAYNQVFKRYYYVKDKRK